MQTTSKLVNYGNSLVVQALYAVLPCVVHILQQSCNKKLNCTKPQFNYVTRKPSI